METQMGMWSIVVFDICFWFSLVKPSIISDLDSTMCKEYLWYLRISFKKSPLIYLWPLKTLYVQDLLDLSLQLQGLPHPPTLLLFGRSHSTEYPWLIGNCVNDSLRNNLCWSSFVLSKWSVEVSKTRCVNDLAKVDETGTGRRGLVLCTHVLYPNANTCPCGQKSLCTRVLVHASPSQLSRCKNVQRNKRHTRSHLLAMPSTTPWQLSMSSLPGLTPFQNLPCRLGCPKKNRSLKFGILL